MCAELGHTGGHEFKKWWQVALVLLGKFSSLEDSREGPGELLVFLVGGVACPCICTGVKGHCSARREMLLFFLP